MIRINNSVIRVWCPKIPLWGLTLNEESWYVDNTGVRQSYSEFPKNWDFGEEYMEVKIK